MKFLVIVVCSLFYLILRIKGNIHMLQQNFYNENNRYIKWGIKKFSNIFKYVDFLMVTINIINIFLKNDILLYFNIFYLIIYIWFKNKVKRSYFKLPLKMTSRVKRLCFTNALIYVIVVILGMNYLLLFQSIL